MWNPPWTTGSGFGAIRSNPTRDRYDQLEAEERVYLGLCFISGTNRGRVPDQYRRVFDRYDAVAPPWLTGECQDWAAAGMKAVE